MRDKAHAKEYNHNRREWYKGYFICTSCAVNEAEPGRVNCKECLKKYRAKHQARREEYNAQKKQLRHERIEAGLCPQCGHPAKPGFKMCGRCRDARNDSTRKYKIKKRLEAEANAARTRVFKPRTAPDGRA